MPRPMIDQRLGAGADVDTFFMAGVAGDSGTVAGSGGVGVPAGTLPTPDSAM